MTYLYVLKNLGKRVITVEITAIDYLTVKVRYASGKEYTFRYDEDKFKTVISNLQKQLNLRDEDTADKVIGKRIYGFIDSENSFIPLPFKIRGYKDRGVDNGDRNSKDNRKRDRGKTKENN